jgi:hypothetical protein
MKYYKKVNQTLTSGNGNPRNKTFKVIENFINNGFAIDDGKSVDFFNNLMGFECSKRHSGCYFEGVIGKEIKLSTFKKYQKAAKIEVENLKKVEELKVEQQKKEREKSKKEWDAKATEKKEILSIRINEVISKVLEIENIKTLISKRLEGDKSNNGICNKAVGIIGYEFANYLGWIYVLGEINKNI